MEDIKIHQDEIVIRNNSSLDVGPYPMDVALTDANGNALIDRETQSWKTTGEAVTWDIRSKEIKIFPRYVGKYLLGIYGFLEEVQVPESSIIKEEERDSYNNEGEVEDGDGKPVKKEVPCKFCDRSFKNVIALSMHMGKEHPEMIKR